MHPSTSAVNARRLGLIFEHAAEYAVAAENTGNNRTGEADKNTPDQK